MHVVYAAKLSIKRFNLIRKVIGATTINPQRDLELLAIKQLSQFST